QLISSRVRLVCCLRAHLMRSAQLASICSLLASLSRPRSRNGPTCSRGRWASSSRTGSFAFAISRSPKAARGVAPRRKRPSRHISPALLDLLIDVLRQVADDALVLVVRYQRQTLAGDPPQLLELLHQVAHDLLERAPVDLVARQVADLVLHLVQLLGQL